MGRPILSNIHPWVWSYQVEWSSGILDEEIGVSFYPLSDWGLDRKACRIAEAEAVEAIIPQVGKQWHAIWSRMGLEAILSWFSRTPCSDLTWMQKIRSTGLDVGRDLTRDHLNPDNNAEMSWSCQSNELF